MRRLWLTSSFVLLVTAVSLCTGFELPALDMVRYLRNFGVDIGKIGNGVASWMYEYLMGTNLQCRFSECCADSYISLNFSDLKKDLETRVYGQHIAIDTVLKSVRRHLRDPDPQKPLVLSFHGWSGGGKSFVSRLVVESIYREAEKSAYVHRFNSYTNFRHPKKIDLYKDQLYEWIFHNASKCERSTFIFDEMDQMPEGLIDVLIPFFGHDTFIDGVNFRKSIFIFLSNTGGNDITTAVLQRQKNGQERESTTLRDMEPVLKRSVSTQQNGFRESKLIEKNLIDYFVPFLPLTREHVRSCIFDELKRQRVSDYNENDIQNVLNELEWFPEDSKLYSKSGCKTIEKKIGLF